MLRALRIGSVVLAVAGLALLYLASVQRELPVQRIGTITPLMNHGVVRVAGGVPRDCYVGVRGGETNYISFVVDDGTGVIRVRAWGAVARSVAQAAGLPSAGGQVDVAGSLRVVQGRMPELRLQAARQLHLARSPSS